MCRLVDVLSRIGMCLSKPSFWHTVESFSGWRALFLEILVSNPGCVWMYPPDDVLHRTQLKFWHFYTLLNSLGSPWIHLLAAVDAIRWVRPDSIVIGYLRVNSEGEEDEYPLFVLNSRNGNLAQVWILPSNIVVSGKNLVLRCFAECKSSISVENVNSWRCYATYILSTRTYKLIPKM